MKVCDDECYISYRVNVLKTSFCLFSQLSTADAWYEL
jgi:hypothetical protein